MGFAVTLNPLGALAGFANGIRGEATGSAINAVAGEQIGVGIEATIDFGASKLQAQYPDLTQDEARILTAGSMMGAASVVDGSAGIKQVLKHLDDKKMHKHFTKDGVKVVKDTRLDGYTSEAAHTLLENKHFKEIKTAEAFNKELSQWYEKPPFIKGGKVGIFETDGSQKFARVFTEGKNQPVGSFMCLKSDIENLTPIQIKNKFDLPYAPTHVADVTPPIGEKIAVGTVNPKNFGGDGMGTQFFSIKIPEENWISNIKKL